MADEKFVNEIINNLESDNDFNFLWPKCVEAFPAVFKDDEKYKYDFIKNICNITYYIFKKDIITTSHAVNTQLFLFVLLSELYKEYRGTEVGTKKLFGKLTGIYLADRTGTATRLVFTAGMVRHDLKIVVVKLGTRYLDTEIEITGDGGAIRLKLSEFTWKKLEGILLNTFPDLAAKITTAHIYAKPITSDGYDYDMYYSEDMAIDSNIWIGGNSDFKTFNVRFYEDLVNTLNDIAADVETIYEDDRTPEEVRAELLETLIHYIRPYASELKAHYTDSDYFEILELSKKYTTCRSSEELDILCKVLEILYREPFTNGTIKGSSPGDWQNYICPTKYEPEMSYIEAVYFGTGTEFVITEDKLDHAPKEIMDEEVYFDYTDLYNDADIRAWIAKNAHCEPYEVIILPED